MLGAFRFSKKDKFINEPTKQSNSLSEENGSLFQ